MLFQKAIGAAGLVLFLILSAATISANGSSAGVGQQRSLRRAPAATVPVSITDFAFTPPTITITVNDTVQWTHNGGPLTTHTATSGTCIGLICTPAPGFDSPFLTQGQTFSHTFTVPGVYPYFCRIHQSAMQGTVIVEAGPLFLPALWNTH